MLSYETTRSLFPTLLEVVLLRSSIWTIPVLMTFCTMGPDVATWRQKIEPMMEANPSQAEQEMLAALEHAHLKGEASLLLSKLYTDQDKIDDAVKYGKQASKLLKDRAEAHLAYASALSSKMSANSGFAMANAGAYRKALDKAIAIDPDNMDVALQKIGYLANAPMVAGGSLKKAKAAADELKAKDEKYGLVAWSIIFRKEGDQAKVEETYNRLIELDPDNHKYQYQLAFAKIQLKKETEAIPLFSSLAESGDEEYVWASRYQLARALVISEQDVAKGAELLRSYVAEAPDSGEDLPPKAGAYWRLGGAEEKLGNIDAARAAYQQALVLDPKDKDAKASLEKLDSNAS